MVGVIQHAFSNTIGNATGTVTIWNTQGSSTTAAATNLVRPQDWNSTHNAFLTIAGNTAGQSTVSGTNIVLAGGNNITLSAATAASAATITVSGAALPNVQQFAPLPLINPAWQTIANNSGYFQPVAPQGNIAVTAVLFPVSISGASSTNSRAQSNTLSFGLYQQGTGASASQLTLLSSVTASIAVSKTSNSNTWTFAVNGNSTSSTAVSWINGANMFQMPMATTLQAGTVYWLGMAVSSATAVAQNLTYSLMWQTNTNITGFGTLGTGGVGGVAANQFMSFDAAIFSNTITSWSNSLPMTQLQRATSGSRIYVEFVSI